MANYAGLSYGNKVYCNLNTIVNPSTGKITGATKCFQVLNTGDPASSFDVNINGETVLMYGGLTIDVVIDTITMSPPGPFTEGLCLICTCHDCNNPDGNAQRAVTWPVSATTATLINPSSPYTLIGSGFLNS